MKITKKIRDTAIQICEAVGNCRFGDGYQITDETVAYDIDASDEALDLAQRAFCVVPDLAEEHSGAEWLEAASLLRDGWKPRDVPVLLDETAQAIVEKLGTAAVESITVTRSTSAIDVDDDDYDADEAEDPQLDEHGDEY
jgi:hypothetical protein